VHRRSFVAALTAMSVLPLSAEGELPGDDYTAYRAIDPGWYLVFEMS
jgi:hypothetical protein